MPAIKALRYTGNNLDEVLNFSRQGEIIYAGDVSDIRNGVFDLDDLKDVYVHTPQGRKLLSIGDWLVQSDKGFHIASDSDFDVVHIAVDDDSGE